MPPGVWGKAGKARREIPAGDTVIKEYRMTANNAIKNKIMGKLMERGETLKSFALRNGYKPNTVQKTLRRFARTGLGQRRRRSLGAEVMNRLTRETGVEVTGVESQG